MPNPLIVQFVRHHLDAWIPVFTGSDYEGLFKMLHAGRFQYFPRSIGEIWDEENKHPDLEVEQALAIHYPACIYFFVSRQNTILATLLERGLRAAISDGSFDRLFDRYNGAAIKRAMLNTRTVLDLNNPLLPDDTPLQQREFWSAR